MKPETPTRVGIISDTHGKLDPRIAEVLEDCDIAVHAGDIMCHSVLKDMKPKSGKVIAVRGNNDTREKWSQQHSAMLSEIDFEANFLLPGGKVEVVHGHLHGRPASLHDRLRETFSQARLIIYGHSHRLVCDTSTEPWVVNPGAAGKIRTFGGPSCLILEASNEKWQINEVKFPLLAKRALT